MGCCQAGDLLSLVVLRSLRAKTRVLEKCGKAMDEAEKKFWRTNKWKFVVGNELRVPVSLVFLAEIVLTSLSS